MLERFFGSRLRHLAPAGEIWTTPELTSAALWAPPGRWKTTMRQDLEIAAAVAHPRLIARAPMLAYGLLGVECRHPPDPPHWYLAVLGTDPEHQGGGLAAAVLAPVLEECDRDGVAAFLESSKESNLDYYARHGFRVTEKINLPRGPRVWQMWREPRS